MSNGETLFHISFSDL